MKTEKALPRGRGFGTLRLQFYDNATNCAGRLLPAYLRQRAPL